MFKITFEYDEAAKMWDAYAEGATTAIDALQGFNAVVITCESVIPRVDANRAELQADGRYKISVGVLSA